jgi:hypothetical protein
MQFFVLQNGLQLIGIIGVLFLKKDDLKMIASRLNSLQKNMSVKEKRRTSTSPKGMMKDTSSCQRIRIISAGDFEALFLQIDRHYPGDCGKEFAQTSLSVFISGDDQGQPAIRAFAGIRPDRGPAGRAFPLPEHFPCNSQVRVKFHKVFFDRLLSPCQILRQDLQLHRITAAAFSAAGIGMEHARDARIQEHCLQFAHPAQVALQDLHRVLDSRLLCPLSFFPHSRVLLGRKQDRAAVCTFPDMRLILSSAVRA